MPRKIRDVAELVGDALTDQSPHLTDLGYEPLGRSDGPWRYNFECDGVRYALELREVKRGG